MKIFISYSHDDETTVENLHKHLSALQREGAIKPWFDREIQLGNEIDSAIMQNLENSDIFLAIVSASFIASDYCYEREMAKAIEMHNDGKMIVIPIIAEPCDWKATPLGALKAAPKDGKPISDWKNKNTAYLDIVMGIRSIVSEDTNSLQNKPTRKPLTENQGSSKYKVRKDFNELEIADFREKAFEQIFTYFEESISEVSGIDGVQGRINKIDAYSFTCSVLNMSFSRGAAHITVHSGAGDGFMGDIYYSDKENAPKNTANGGFRIETDGYELFLSNNSFMHYGTESKLTPDEAAEQLWNEFLQQAGISCAA